MLAHTQRATTMIEQTRTTPTIKRMIIEIIDATTRDIAQWTRFPLRERNHISLIFNLWAVVHLLLLAFFASLFVIIVDK